MTHASTITRLVLVLEDIDLVALRVADYLGAHGVSGELIAIADGVAVVVDDK